MILDHFHPPLKGRRHWDGFHHQWACNLASDLNLRLPAGWFAEPNIRFGIEIDVATYEEPAALAGTGDKSRTITAWAPPQPQLTIDFPMTTDVVEVLISNDNGGPRLAGAIELVSPTNKDRPETREAFVSKCDTYLREGIGLVVVDIVTDRHANLHAELMDRVQPSFPTAMRKQLYAAAYRPFARKDHTQLEIWCEALQIGGKLPLMPLYLKSGPCAQVDLNGTYETTCAELRIENSG